MQSRHAYQSRPRFRGPLSLLAPLLGVRSSFRPSVRPLLRLLLHLSVRPCVRGAVRANARHRPARCRLQAWRFADIPKPLPIKNIRAVPAVVICLSNLSASLALDGCATTSALARQRFSITSADVSASVLAGRPA